MRRMRGRGRRGSDFESAAMSTANWIPRTALGKKVMEGAITLDEIFDKGIPIKESEIIDKLIPSLKSDIIFVGGSPGKGGGIQRTPTLRTARMHRSGRRYKITATIVVGNGDGYIGIGLGSANEHRAAIAKAMQDAKLNVIPIRRGCGSWKCKCGGEHSIPFSATGKSGSIRVTLMPAPKGAGLLVSEEMKKVMILAGIKDIWSKTRGNTRARRNMAMSLMDAFRNLNKMRIPFAFTSIKEKTKTAMEEKKVDVDKVEELEIKETEVFEQ